VSAVIYGQDSRSLIMRTTKKRHRDDCAFRLPPAHKRAAEKAAADDGRSLSDIIRRALERHQVELGYLPAAAPGQQPGA
jgi:hypothetical protein